MRTREKTLNISFIKVIMIIMPVKATPQLLERIKRIIIEAGSPIIPISAIFEALGYTGATGITWGILVGIVSAAAVELGYEVEKLGAILVLKKKEVKQK